MSVWMARSRRKSVRRPSESDYIEERSRGSTYVLFARDETTDHRKYVNTHLYMKFIYAHFNWVYTVILLPTRIDRKTYFTDIASSIAVCNIFYRVLMQESS